MKIKTIQYPRPEGSPCHPFVEFEFTQVTCSALISDPEELVATRAALVEAIERIDAVLEVLQAGPKNPPCPGDCSDGPIF